MTLRFFWVCLSSIFCVGWNVPRANYMIAHPEKYTEEEMFALAIKISDSMRRRANAKTIFYGRENLPQDRQYIMYSNHQGKYDALGIFFGLDKPTGVLWEKRQAKKFLSRQICGLLKAEMIELTDPRDMVRAIKSVTEKVRDGRSFLIFPEGGYTKKTHNDIGEFKTGCFTCSLQTKTPIVPVCIYDSWRVLGSNTFERVTSQVHFLTPIMPEEYEGMKKQELADLVKSRIEERMNEIKAGELPKSKDRGVKRRELHEIIRQKKSGT